ncbi:hypothetical protein [Roseovarius sp. D22-M7]|uniref:hypothetical protein n=1 Tax=Roseovarius sp. D22-M7 TaxID=3127116 RepID=UPI00300F9746
MRVTLGVMMMTLLGACAPAVPFDDYREVDSAARDAELSGGGLQAPDAVSSEPLSALSPDAEASRIAADAQAALAATGSGEDMMRQDTSTPQGGVANAEGISRENDFEAVDRQRSIEQDAARIARNRARYEVVQPQEIGSRPGDVGPNIVAYALASTHPKGTQIYNRIGINLENRSARNCAQFSSPDKAQIAFLSQGGPERDRQALDPDGDGYACGWDPAPYRRAVAD